MNITCIDVIGSVINTAVFAYIEGSARKGCNYILSKCTGETKNIIIFYESSFIQCKQDILSKITIETFVIYNFVHISI